MLNKNAHNNMKWDNDTTEVHLVSIMITTKAEKCPESWEFHINPE